MKILKLKEKFQIEIPETKEIINVQEFELTTNPDGLTYEDIIKDLETLHNLDSISFSSNLLYELIHEKRAQFLVKKYGYREKTNLYFLRKGLHMIDGVPNFDYIGLYQVRYHQDGQVVSSEGPNNNYLLKSWEKYENYKYSIITIDS